MKLRMYWKIFLSFSLVVVVQVFVLWGIGVNYITHNIRLDEERQSENMAQNVFRSLESTMESGEQLHQIIQSLDSVNRVTSSYEKENAYRILCFRRDLVNYVEASSEISAAFIYIPGKDIVISSFAPTEKVETFLQYDFKSGAGGKLGDYLLESRSYYLHIGINDYLSEKRQGMIYIAPFLHYLDAEYVPKVAVYIDLDQWSKKLFRVMPEGSGIILELGEESVKMGETSEETEDYFFSREYGTGLLCKVTIPSGRPLEQTANMKYRFTAILIFCLAVDMLLFYTLSRLNTKPINNIRQALGSELRPDTAEADGEIEQIIEEIGKLVDREKKLKEQTNLTREMVKERYIMTLLTKSETHDRERLKRELELADITFPYRFFAAVTVYTDRREKDGCGMMPVLFDCECTWFWSHEIDGGFVFLLNFSQTPQECKYLEKLKEILREEGQAFNIGVGGCVEAISAIHDSYIQSQKVMDSKIAGTMNNIIYWDTERRREDYVLSSEDENRLIVSLKNGDESKVEELLDHIIGENQGKEVSVGTMKNLFMNLMMTGWKGCGREALCLRQKYSTDSILKTNLSAEGEKMIRAMYSEICALNQKEKSMKQSGSLLINEVVDYLETNYMNPSLSLTEVAEHFGVHKVYLSSIFNEKMECSFVEFVNRKRIERAVAYMQQDTYRMSDLAGKSGFGSETTFRREFKKYMGVSPKQYYDMIH